MNTKKFLITFIAVFILFEILNYLVHGVILGSTYMDETMNSAFRSQETIESNMWVMWVTDLIWTFFFVFFFVKGYENKGIMEGIRYGIYIGIFFFLVVSYGNYVIYPVSYSLTFQWFLYGLIESVILGAVASLIYKPKSAEAAPA
jgi:hypothetical protein